MTNRCIHCNKTFKSKKILDDDHIDKRHPDPIAPVSRKVNEWTNCTFGNLQPSRLKEHIKIKYHDIALNKH
nr:unnamed protein product [Callosobruchus analis]